jgi:outer membrane protein assembly factor BamB
MMKTPSLPLAAAFLALASAPIAHAEDWPCFRGPRQDGISQEKLPVAKWSKTGWPTLWTAKLGVGFSNVAVAAGKVYSLGFADGQDTLWCLDEKSGNVVWKHTWPSKLGSKMYEGGPGATPTVHEGRVFAASKYGRLWCVDATTGKPIWEHDVVGELKTADADWGMSGSPVIYQKSVIFNVRDGGIAFDQTTGKRLWESKEGMPGFDTPVRGAVKDVPALFMLQPRALVVSNAATGEEIARHKFGSGFYCSAADPVVRGNQVFIATGDVGGELLDLAAGGPAPKSVWKTDEMGCHMSSATLIGDTLYGQSVTKHIRDNQVFRAIDWRTGDTKWEIKEGWGNATFLATAEGHLLAVTDKGEGHLLRVSPQKCERLGSAPLISGKVWTTPVLSNGRLYLRNATGELKVFDAKG